MESWSFVALYVCQIYSPSLKICLAFFWISKTYTAQKDVKEMHLEIYVDEPLTII